MSDFKFVSHDAFPEDENVKELVYLCFYEKCMVAYARKVNKNGGLFWGVASIGATRNGQKEYFAGFMQDSNFLDKSVKDFLEKRKWETSVKAEDNDNPPF